MANALSYQAVLKLLLPDDWRETENYQMGLEREMLRVDTEGELAPTPHPESLGSALTHPDITLDFAENQLELVTPPFQQQSELIRYMENLHAFLAQRLPEDEHLWLLSMPPDLSDAARMQPGYFGRSNPGRLKTIYRRGLANRYGKKMQVISGIHYNYSWSDRFWQRLHERVGDSRKLSIFRSENYLALMRNYLRLSWILAYLMGASPAIDRSFIKREPGELEVWGKRTLIGPHATSLRMSRIGYVNSSRCSASVNYNSLTDYLSALYQAVSTECPGFSLIGLQDKDGKYRQINTHLLQIENEHYALIRPKQPPEPGERPFQALRSRGVSYVEVRALDAQFDHPIGIHEEQLVFLRLFLHYCLFKPNPTISREEELVNNENHQRAALSGRQPGLLLQRDGEEVTLQDWLLEVLEDMRPLAQYLDSALRSTQYGDVLDQMETRARDPELTPSARALAALQDAKQDFWEWGLEQSLILEQKLKTTELSAETLRYFDERVQASLRSFADEDREPDISYETFLKDYFRLKEKDELSA